MGLFKRKPNGVPNRASNPARRPASSSSDWLTSAAQNYRSTPEGKAATAKVEGQIAMDKWRSNTSKARSAANAEAVAKMKPEPKKQERGGVAEVGYTSQRM